MCVLVLSASVFSFCCAQDVPGGPSLGSGYVAPANKSVHGVRVDQRGVLQSSIIVLVRYAEPKA